MATDLAQPEAGRTLPELAQPQEDDIVLLSP